MANRMAATMGSHANDLQIYQGASDEYVASHCIGFFIGNISTQLDISKVVTPLHWSLGIFLIAQLL